MESDVDRLLAKFENGALLRPSEDTPNLVDLARALWGAAGVEVGGLTPAAEAMRRRIGDNEHLVFVLADGLGMQMLEAMPAAAFLWSHLEGTLNTVFPSTTAVALTSLATGSWPGRHGIVGHWLQLPEAGAVTVLSLTGRSEGRPLATTDGLFIEPSMASGVPRETLALLPAGIVNSGYSAYAAGSNRAGYRSLNEAVDLAIQFIEAASTPTYTYLYLSRIDDTAHELGTARLELVGAIRDLDRAMQRLALALDGRARVVLTADHGHLPVRPIARRTIRGGDELGRLFRSPPTGDARTVMFHLQPDSLEDFAAAFRYRFGPYFCLLTPDEVAALGLLGPDDVAPETLRRLGDAVAISLADDTLEFRPRGGRPDPRLAWPSHHSGLTAAEMRVPLLVI